MRLISSVSLPLLALVCIQPDACAVVRSDNARSSSHLVAFDPPLPHTNDKAPPSVVAFDPPLPHTNDKAPPSVVAFDPPLPHTEEPTAPALVPRVA